MDQGLAGKRVLVTGGTRGIGRSTVLALARAGAQVVACHRSKSPAADSLVSELKEIGEGHLLVQADLTAAAGATEVARATREHLGGLDVLVNNVGVDGHVPFADLGEDEWNRVIDHNLTAPYLVTRAVLALLVEGASVINIGSSVALRGRHGGVHYSSSKAALLGFTRALCKELGHNGIRVNAVSPGVVEDEEGTLPPPVRRQILGMTALGRLGRSEDVAGAVLFLAGDTSRYVSGAILNVDGGI
jgi:3-oxoacyl-[acyl-carrier protein] reductase